MSEDTARKIANVALGAAAIGAAYYVLRTPPLRRAAVGLAVTALTTRLPAWLGAEVREAWTESGRRAEMLVPAGEKIRPARPTDAGAMASRAI